MTDTQDSVKIGKLVQNYVEKILNKCDDNELRNLMNKEYSRDTFGIYYPFCTEVENACSSRRYYKAIHHVQDKKLRVCCEWVEGSRILFYRYIRSNNITDTEGPDLVTLPDREVHTHIKPAPGTPQPQRAQSFKIHEGDTGHTYDTIFGAYLAGAKNVEIDDPYIRKPHQVGNFVRFCEMVVKASPTVRRIDLITRYDNNTDRAMVGDRLEQLTQSLRQRDVLLGIQFDQTLHDRDVRIDKVWSIKIGRGLDFYLPADGYFVIGATDFTLRKCLATNVDIRKI